MLVVLLFLNRGPDIVLIDRVRQISFLVPHITVGIILQVLKVPALIITSPDSTPFGAVTAPVTRLTFTSSHLSHLHVPVTLLQTHWYFQGKKVFAKNQ